MRAVEYDAFGPAHVLEVRDVAEPPLCGADEIAVRVRAASVNPKDTFVRKGRFVAMTGTTFPRRAGYDWSGTVTDAGADVTGFAAGDLAYGMLNGWAGGACAEAIVVKASEAARAPRSISLVSAAAIPLAALTALQALVDEAGLEAGRRVLVNVATTPVITTRSSCRRMLISRFTSGCGCDSTWTRSFTWASTATLNGCRARALR